MRVAVLGQGSIGRRHAANLTGLGHEVVAYDPRPFDGVPAAASEQEALASADAAIVASPSSEHARQARLALEAGVPVLVEKPLATTAAEAVELERLAAERGGALGVAMNLRFHPGVAALREAVRSGALGRVLRASCWCGSWLPGWRPGTDYRESYSARRELGGGVLLDAIHELDYLVWLLGRVRAVSATLTKVSDLEIDVEDVALLQLEHESGALATVTLDYFDRRYHRGCRLVGSEGGAEWRWDADRVAVWGADGTPREIPAPHDVAPTYRAEVEGFLAAAAAGEPPPVTAAEGRHVLEVVDAARAATADGRRRELG